MAQGGKTSEGRGGEGQREGAPQRKCSFPFLHRSDDAAEREGYGMTRKMVWMEGAENDEVSGEDGGGKKKKR